MRKKIMTVCAGALFALTACTFPTPQGGLPEMTFAQVQPVYVNASRIEVVDAYVSPMAAPNVEHLFPTAPAAAIHKLVNQQIVVQPGTGNVLRVIIDDASVREKAMPVPAGVQGVLVREPAKQYDGKVVVRFEMASESAPDLVTGRARVTSSRSKGIGENAAPAEKDRLFFALTEEMMNDISEGIRTSVRDTLGVR